MKKNREVSQVKDDKINCDFVRGSVVHVEHLWKFASYILKTFRRRMTPTFFGIYSVPTSEQAFLGF